MNTEIAKFSYRAFAQVSFAPSLPFLGSMNNTLNLEATFPLSMLVTHLEWQAPRALKAEAYRDNRFNLPPYFPRNVQTQYISSIYNLHLRGKKDLYKFAPTIMY